MVIELSLKKLIVMSIASRLPPLPVTAEVHDSHGDDLVEVVVGESQQSATKEEIGGANAALFAPLLPDDDDVVDEDRPFINEQNDEEERRIPSDEQIANLLLSTYREGDREHLVKKEDLIRSFYQSFELILRLNHHTIVTRVGKIVYQTFRKVREARPGTAAHGYRAPHYRYLRLR